MYEFGLTMEQMARIERDFAAVPARDRIHQLFDVMTDCGPEERLCLKCLYAYMPASDLASYDGSFFLKAVRDTLAARRAVSWGAGIDGELFFNYVLPVRINNEDLVDYREEFFKELFPRVRELSLRDAVLEVNYWCLEKATYRSTDIRTSSPLNVVRNAFGRCGEESVLCVAALRSVGIPARQCYTPRWAHCDDNHAWVEAWVDGSWHFIGACEPEPVLDRGWFTEPAQRGMLIHARVFSRLVSEPEMTNQTPVMSQINILNHYARTKTLRVRVTGEAGAPVEGAEVRFELMNFAQLYPLAVIKTNACGEAHLLIGFGDLYIHVSKDGRFLHKKAGHSCEELHFSMIGARTEDIGSLGLELVPPPYGVAPEPEFSRETAACHEERIAQAETLRRAFESTFLHGERAEKFAAGFTGYRKEIAELIVLSNGNHPEITRFLQAERGIPLRYRVLLLQSLRKKDLSDSTCAVLESHLKGAWPYKEELEEDLFVRYVLCPWAHFEKITNYRGFIEGYFSEEQKTEFRRDPRAIHCYIEEATADCGDRDYATINASPRGLLELKYGSALSRKILFVAICRTLGVPARMSEIDMKVEYWREASWHAIDGGEDRPVDRCCRLTLKKKREDIPFSYEKNFTIARLTDGVYHTLGLGGTPFEDDTVHYLLEEGRYRITTANRLNDGSILAILTHVELRRNQEQQLVIDLRESDVVEDAAVSLPDIPVRTLDGKQWTAQGLLGTGKTYALAFIEEGREPTEHLLNEILEQKEAFSRERDRLLLLLQGEESLHNPLLRSTLEATGMPVAFCDTAGCDAFNAVLEALNTDNGKLPLVLGLDRDGKCVFHTSGYNVGTGSLLLRLIAKQ